MDPGLLKAIRQGNRDRIKRLAKEKPDFFTKRIPQGNTVLHISARLATGNNYVIDILIHPRKWDDLHGLTKIFTTVEVLRMHDIEGNTPLHIAVRNGHFEVVRNILSNESRLLQCRNEAGKSPLSITIEASLAVIAQYIYDTSLDCLLKEKFSLVYERDNHGQTPLHLTAKNGRLNILKMLVNDYPDASEVFDHRQCNILHLAAEFGHAKMVSYLLNLPEIKDFVNSSDVDGNNPLHLAAMHFISDVVYILSKNKKVNIRVTNNKLKTALEIAHESPENPKRAIQKAQTEMFLHLTIKALKAAYANQALDPEDILENLRFSGILMGDIDDKGAKKWLKLCP
ncbi:hypothetical protein EZV62_009126 [Acer yangbiense]|uniref:Uncharacterized protein n=1 Tax=Acer yangbiense TaxID=1000413 RepID=A0A5C7IFF4_9ROSI|nr:hypothetical protein EZV62_009126 [Acer yangbiense]